jgi:ribonuclease HII
MEKGTKMNKKPSFDIEKDLLSKNFELIFGMDEVGRGSFAGPLVASAVCFKQEFSDDWFHELNDSKLLTVTNRERLSKLVLENAECFMEVIDIETINEIGIGKCNILIFENLIKNILNKHKNKNIYFLIDGKNTFKSANTKFIVKGDSKSISIAAASIIAKVYRDKLMDDLDKVHTGYNFSKNKGYGTKFHQEAIKKLGLCSIHRKSFDLKKFL